MSYGSFDAADAKISCRVAGARWSEHELQLKCVILSRKIQLMNFDFLAVSDVFSCRYRITCARVATHAIFTARWRRA